LLYSYKTWRDNNAILFVFTVLQESVATLGGTLPGLIAEDDQEEEAEGIFDHWNTIIIKTIKCTVFIYRIGTCLVPTYPLRYTQWDS